MYLIFGHKTLDIYQITILFIGLNHNIHVIIYQLK